MFSRIEAFELFIVNKFVLLYQMELRLNNLEEMASTIFQYSLLCLDDIFTPGNLGFDLKIVRPYLKDATSRTPVACATPDSFESLKKARNWVLINWKGSPT
jgi:hypothetical protein